MLQNASLLAIVAVDTAENEPSEVDAGVLLTNESKTLEDSLKGYYQHVKYMPEHVARRWHAVRWAPK